MVVRAILASLLMTAIQPAAQGPAPVAVLAQRPDPSRSWYCRHSVELARGTLDVTRNLDAEGRPEYDYLFWQSRQSIGGGKVGWQRGDSPTSTILPWRLRTDMILATLRLTRSARRPAWLVLRVDGQILSRRLLPNMSDLPEFDRNRLELLASFMADSPRPVPVPDVTNADEALVTVEEEGGETLARYLIHRPARDLIDGVIAQAEPALAAAAADYRNRCREDTGAGRVE